MTAGTRFGAEATQALRYLVVGGIGFVVDAGILWLLVRAGANPWLARLVSFPAAVLVTWWLNRAWTFQSRAASRGREVSTYFLVQIFGALTNFAVYSAVLTVIPPTAGNAVLALAAGSAVGLIVNFAGAKLLVFTKL